MMAENAVSLESFRLKLDKNIIHLKTCCGNKINYLCAWYIRNLASEAILSSRGFKDANGVTHSFQLKYCHSLADFVISSDQEWDVSVSTQSGTVLPLCKSPSSHPVEYRMLLECIGVPINQFISIEDFHKLRNSSGIITCQMTRRKLDNNIFENISSNTTARNTKYLKSLEADLKNNASAFSKEKVTLRVGHETELVNKAVLCARSPVFAKMFETDMKEQKSNTVTITDVKMPVLRVLVSFLRSGLLPDCDTDFLCDLYYAANKYDIQELHQACIGSLLSNITLRNIVRVLKLSSLHNDDLLKSAIMTLIGANIETVALTSDWKDLMSDDPELALNASTFFDL